jgi:superfamily II DNA or RNA helicase
LTTPIFYGILSVLNRFAMKLRPQQEQSLAAMIKHQFGQIIAPTGAGKTLIMIYDAIRRMNESSTPLTILICAPRILLAEQLSSEFLEHIDFANVLHVHSGETHHKSTTNPGVIAAWNEVVDNHKLIFTTYNSLRRVNESEINVDVAYYDEAHNATRVDFFDSVASCNATNYYYFTATPKHRRSSLGTGMNNKIVFGQVISNISAPELVEQGNILPPTIQIHEVDFERQKGLSAADNDASTLIDMIDGLDSRNAQKVLVAAPSSKVLWQMLARTSVLSELAERGFDVLHITSKFGAYVNQTKVDRETFFDTFNTWGQDPERKFIIFHYSILSEGINVHGLTHTILLRNLPIVEMAQTIGRVIRLNKDDAKDVACGKIEAGNFAMYRKPTGFVTVPVFKNYGKKTQRRLEEVVDTIFVKGQPAIDVR